MKHFINKVNTRVANLHKFGYVSNSPMDNKNVSFSQYSYLNKKVMNSVNLFPYGMSANPPKDTLAVLINICGNESNSTAIPFSTKNRFKNLKEGEVALGNEVTGASVKFSSDGNIDLNTGGEIKMTTDSIIASRLCATDSNNNITSTNLVNWIQSTTGTIDIKDDGNGGIDINTDSSHSNEWDDAYTRSVSSWPAFLTFSNHILTLTTGYYVPSTTDQSNWNSKEPGITAGTSSQYWRGDKTWQTLDATAVGLSNVTNDAQVKRSEMGVALGVATLDLNAKIPVSQLPNSVMEYQGAWDALNNLPTLADGTGNPGDVYRVSVAGTQNLGSGTQTFYVGDFVICSATLVWQRSPMEEGVVSVNNLTGVVSLGALSPLSWNATSSRYEIQQANTSQSGYLSNTDWNTFNSKQNAITTGNLTESTSSVLTISSGTGAVIGSGTSIQVKQASNSQGGYLSSTDWSTFNSKEPAITAGTTAQYWRGDKSWQTLDKTAVGLGNVDNTADANKNVLSATKWTTARNLAGNSVDGSGNVAFSNKFIVQGTADAGLSGAQFLGALGTGIVKNTTTTGVLSIAIASDFPTLNQDTTGTAAKATDINITNDVATATSVYPVWVTANTGQLPAKVSSTKISFVPSTGILVSRAYSGNLLINRLNIVGSGISWSNLIYNAWCTYMSPPTAANSGPTANITPPTGTYVTSWALRNFVENTAGFGFTWESGTVSSTAPTVIAELRASDGLFHAYGAIYGDGGFVTTNTTEATTGGAGSIKTSGGIYATKAIISGSTTASSSTITGSIITAGGIGVAGAGYFGGLVNAAGGFVGNVTGNVSGSSGSCTGNAASSTYASNITIANDVTTNADMFPTWVTANTGNIALKVSSTQVKYHPSTGLFTLPLLSSTGTTDSSSISTGAIITAGGLGVAKNIYLGGVLDLPTTSSTVGQILVNGSTIFHTYGGTNLFLGLTTGNYTLTPASATDNYCLGEGCFFHLTTGTNNFAGGYNSLTFVTSGSYNVGIGGNTALYQLTTGSYNLALGFGAGFNYTSSESSNLLLHNLGTVGESNVIRIGSQGTGNGQQNKCFIAGTYNTAIGATIQPVSIDSTHQIGASNYSYHPVTDAIAAHAGGGQASATALTTEINIITTCASTNDSVLLPVAIKGMLITVKNEGAQTLAIYPQSSSYMNGTQNAAYSLAAGASIRFTAVDTTHWKSI